MKVVYKYNLGLGPNEITLPKDSKIVAFRMQEGKMCIWAVVYTMQPEEVRRLNVRGTGQELFDNEEHIATLQDPPYVWHLFEEQVNMNTGGDLNDE